MAKRVPTPGVLRTVSSPPISSASMREMVSPRPVPPVAFTPAEVPRWKGSNTRCSSSSLMPGPVSSISKRAISPE